MSKLPSLRRLERAVQLDARDDLGEVEEGAGDRGRRNPAVLGDVGRIEMSHAVNVDPGTLTPTVAGHRDVDSPARARTDGEVGSGGAGAQRRVRSAGQDGRHPASFLSKGSVPHGVDADVDSMKATGLAATADRTSADRTSADAEPTELPEGDDPMLASSELGQRGLPLGAGWLTSSVSMAPEVIHLGHTIEVEVEMHAGGGTKVTKA
jgi:hypothetical protein